MILLKIIFEKEWIFVLLIFPQTKNPSPD